MSEQLQILIYEDTAKAVDVRLDEGRETVWLTQRQMGEIFETTPENVLMHLQNIFSDEELDEEATTKDFLVVRQEGRRQVRRNIQHYNLDAIISVGYRVNSRRAVHFRQWATRVLREHLTQGWTLHQQRFEANAREQEAAMTLVRKAAHSPALDLPGSRGLVDIVARYAQTFLLLQRYDEGLLSEPDVQTGGRLPSLETARSALDELKGEPAYPSIESKAAHLLYFVIKNHPFADGNKRSAAFLFVDFLHRNDRLLSSTGEPVINDVGLAALTLLVAESAPANKETMIRLIMNMLAGETATS